MQSFLSSLGARVQKPAVTELMTQALSNPNLISLAAGFTDNEHLPADIIQKALHYLLKQPKVPEFLQYGTTQGRTRLRELSSELLNKHQEEAIGVFKAEECMITNGSQQALYLGLQTLCDPGDIVLVEGPTYFVLLSILEGMGVQAVSMPMRPDYSIDIPQLDAWIQKTKAKGTLSRVKAIYLDSYYANPSAHSMSLDNKVALGTCLQKHNWYVPIFEDSAYRELYFKSPHRVPSIFSINAFDPFPKLYVGTYTKPLASGLRIGYGYCSDPLWREKMLYIKGHQDFGSSNFTQALIEVILEQGWYEAWIESLHGHYAKKLECFLRVAQESQLEQFGWRWRIPEGGLMVWLEGPKGLDTSMGSAFYRACLAEGVFYVPGNLCFAEGAPKNAIRLSIGTHPVGTLEEGLQRLAKACEKMLLKTAFLDLSA